MSGLAKDAWVLVCDRAKALLLSNVGSAREPRLEVVETRTQDNPKTADQGTDRPGRRVDGPSGHRSAMPQTDWHAQAERQFARDLAEMLLARARAGDFAQLVLVAPPTILGELRASLHDEVQSRVVAEVAKTLTNHPVDEIGRLLSQDP